MDKNVSDPDDLFGSATLKRTQISRQKFKLFLILKEMPWFKRFIPTFHRIKPRTKGLSTVSLPETTFYRRELPPSLHALTSEVGRSLFKESLASGHAEIYFSLSGNFTMQSEPAFCGLGSLVMVLNALSVDPGKRWKGVWRWYSDDLLECTPPIKRIQSQGLTLTELASLARCNGLDVISKRADKTSRAEFIQDLKSSCSSQDVYMVVNFSRQALDQTGDGHFSPLGAYHPLKNEVLVMDTARFKYPSYFCSADALYDAMHPVDAHSRLPRGYLLLTKGHQRPLSLIKMSFMDSWPEMTRLITLDLPLALSQLEDLSRLWQVILSRFCVPDKPLMLQLRAPGVDLAGKGLSKEFTSDIHMLMEQVQQHALFLETCSALHVLEPVMNLNPSDKLRRILSTIILLSLPEIVFEGLAASLKHRVTMLRQIPPHHGLLRQEIARISEQFEIILNTHCKCGSKHYPTN